MLYLWARACIAGIVLMLFAANFLAATAAYAATPENGRYTVALSAYQASGDALSMCNGALENPAQLDVEDGRATLRVALKPVKLGALEGYLGCVECFPNWTGSGLPGESEAVEASVVSTYGIQDDYNAKKSADAVMAGRAYPKEVAFPWNLDASECYVRVYVPVMNSINAGSGWQFVRLRADYATLKKADDTQSETSGSSEKQDDEDGSKSEGSKSGTGGGSGNAGSSEGGSKSGSGSSGKSGSSDAGKKESDSSASASEKLNFKNLPDGTFTVRATLVKVDRETLSMADAAMDHTLALRVKDGAYTLTLKLNRVTFAGQSSYLGTLRYYLSGYGTDSYGAPTGKTKACKVLSYQMDGEDVLADSYGADYPAQVQVPLVAEAKSDGLVPLQVFVPIMESIAAGTGTQSMYLKLDTSTVSRGSQSGTTDSSGSDSPGDTSGDSSGQGSGSSAANANPASAASSGLVVSGSTLPTAVGTAALAAPAGAASSLPAGNAKPAAASQSAQNGTATGEAPKSATTRITEVQPAGALGDAASAAASASEKHPPLGNALAPVAAGGVAVVALGAGSALLRRRDWIFDEVL